MAARRGTSVRSRCPVAPSDPPAAMKPPRAPSRRSAILLAAALLAAGLLAASRSAPAALARMVEPPRAAADSADARITPAARAQLARAWEGTAGLRTPAAAVAAGYRPMFGQVPLQGEHYVRVDLVASDRFDVARPPVLMFAPVRGTPTLVGAAYAYLHPVGAPPPAGFDGDADVWHGHPGLAQAPGREIVMTHAWFVGAPDGPFARYNPWLPYLAAGLAPPDRATLAHAAHGPSARRLGIALALAATPPMLFELVEARAGAAVRAQAAVARTAITRLAPRLASAERGGDRAAYSRLAAEAVDHGDALVRLHRDAAADRPAVRRLVDRTVDEFMGRGHGIEEELDALLRGAALPDAGVHGTHQHDPGH